jgi:hypothetical protein
MVKLIIKNVTKQVKQLLNSYKDNEYFNTQHSKIIKDIYQPYLQHKYGEKTIIKIQRKMDTTKNQKRYPQIWFTFEDLQETTTNTKNAIRFKCTGKLPSGKNKMNEEMRLRIKPQTLKLKMLHRRDDNTLLCDICKKYFDFKVIDCDHHKISFDNLSKTFCKENKLNNYDETFLQYMPLWVKYHEKNTILRFICKEDHVKYGLKK